MDEFNKTESPKSLPKLERNKSVKNQAKGFGAFGGVFTPCTLTILGVIMFLRFGYVVGNSGLFSAILIILVAKVITTLTTLSLSAIATNTKVQGGGAYYLISRSLGVEFGGAIGVVFFLAQAISVALYVIGFTEALAAVVGDSVNFKVAACITNLIVFGCVFIGAGWTIRVQYLILAILVASLVSFFVGAFDSFSLERLSTNLHPSYIGSENIFTMFALFFPAVTGIMAGANMSGDLRNPAKSIPSGTLWAVFVTAIIYALMALFLAGTQSSQELTQNNMIVGTVSRWPILITAGVFAATLSSALGSMMGAPRILQALARDSVFPSLRLFAKGSGRNGEPRHAVVLTFVISTICILAADLNTIAPLITMAFMITYGTINLATFYEGTAKNPSYRPTFRYNHRYTSLLGALSCFGVMFFLNSNWALISMLIMGAIYFYIYRKHVESRWGDLNSGLLFERTRKNLLRMERMLYHPKNWRPIIMAMSGAGRHRAHLAAIGYWLTSGRGILNLGQVIQGEVEERVERISNQEVILKKFIVDNKLEAFPNVVAAPTVIEGIEYLVQCSGLGALRPNILLLGWPDQVKKGEALIASLRTISFLRRNVILAKWEVEDDSPQVPEGSIDVWWRGADNGELMLLLAHLLRQNSQWQGRTIRLMRVVADQEAEQDVLQHLEELAVSARIDVECLVFVSDNPMSAIQDASKTAGLVFLGYQMPDEGTEAQFYERLTAFSSQLNRVLFVNSTSNMKLDS